MLKRLSESNFKGGRQNNKYKAKKYWAELGLSEKEIEEKQRALFENNDGEEDSDAEYFKQHG